MPDYLRHVFYVMLLFLPNHHLMGDDTLYHLLSLTSLLNYHLSKEVFPEHTKTASPVLSAPLSHFFLFPCSVVFFFAVLTTT